MAEVSSRTQLAALVRDLRLQAELTQEALAERAGLGPRSVQAIELGESRPRRETVEQLARALGLNEAARAELLKLAKPVPRDRRRGLSDQTSRDSSLSGRDHGRRTLSQGQEPSSEDGLHKSPSAPPHNLPVQLTSFVGREREIAEVRRLLGTTRLLTLTGTGGCGKTRLAYQVAADLIDGYEDGVWVVELAALSDPELVPQTVAQALGLLEQSGVPILETVQTYLRPKHLLLVIDNCEHLLDASAKVADTLLRNCPGLRILATSREALGTSGESSYRVPSLALPDPRHLPALASLSEYEAVRLFVERAQAVLPDFVLTDQNSPSVAQICWRLDGIPLAIELAAARLSALTVEQVAARLDDRFRLLTGGSRTALRRQQTLRATIDWSYDLLTDLQRLLLRRLTVFAGGWRLEAAEAVCSEEGLDAEEALDLLARLVDRSLVVVERSSSEARYRLPETIRQYALERLFESGEVGRVRDRHLAYYSDLGEQYYDSICGPDEVTWLETLELEHDNLRAALTRSLAGEPSQAERGLRLGGALGHFWFLRVHRQEGLQWLDRLLARCEAKATPERARALYAAAQLAFILGERRALSLSVESAHIYQQLDDVRGMVFARRNEGMTLAFQLGDLARGRAVLEEALAVARSSGDRWLIAHAQVFLAYFPGVVDRDTRWALAEQALPALEEAGDLLGIAIAHRVLGSVALWRGDYLRAIRSFGEDLARTRALGDAVGAATALRDLGDASRLIGKYDQATTCYEEGLSILDAVGWSGVESNIQWQYRLGDVALEQGDVDRAAALYSEGLARARRVLPSGSLGGFAVRAFWACFRGLAAVASRRGQSERAARLLGAAPAPGDADAPWMRADYSRLLSAVRSPLSEEAFSRAFAEGQAMTLEQAIEYALRDDEA